MVVGGSYSASMATWARLKYPHLVNIGYASSGPLRAVADFYGRKRNSIIQFTYRIMYQQRHLKCTSCLYENHARFFLLLEYYEVVNDNIGLVSRDCLETIREAIVQLENLMVTEDGLDSVSEKFK